MIRPLLVACVVPFVAAMVMACNRAEVASPAPAKRATLAQGTWWITKTHVLESQPLTLSGPFTLRDYVYYHKWQVRHADKVGDKEVWVIDVRAWYVPADVPNDVGEKPLFTLYITKATCSLLKIEANLRGGRYYVSGGQNRHYEETYAQNQPVIPNWLPSNVPLDVPLMKWPGAAAELPAEASGEVSEYVESKSKEKIRQRLQGFSSGPDFQSQGAIVALEYSGSYRTTCWTQTRPWWTEWRCVTGDGHAKEMWCSKVIEWSDLVAKNPATTRKQ